MDLFNNLHIYFYMYINARTIFFNFNNNAFILLHKCTDSCLTICWGVDNVTVFEGSHDADTPDEEGAGSRSSDGVF